MRFGLPSIRKLAMSKPDVGQPWCCLRRLTTVGLAWLCSARSLAKSKATHSRYPLPAGSPVSGVVGADQVKSLDWRAREAARIGNVSEEVVAQVPQRLHTLLAGGG
jgi:mRNA-degrading endonuclease toxin of MazEF toxin-antitoxin module